MREFKIIVDESQEDAFRCYEREVNCGFFDSEWMLKNSAQSHEEAFQYLSTQNGKYVGTYMKDGTPIAVKGELRITKNVTYSSEGLMVKKTYPVPEFLDENQDVLFKRRMGKK